MMKVIVLGGGAVGSEIAQQLIASDIDVVVIERDPEVARILSNRLDCAVINAMGNSTDVLRKAGTADADVFVAVTGSDEVNMVACGLVASEFDVPRKIARIRNISYSETILTARKFMGIDLIINPEIEAAYELLKSIEHGALSDIIVFAHSPVQIRNLPVPRGSQVIGKPLKDAFPFISEPLLIAAIYRGNDYVIPSGNTVIQEEDILYIAGKTMDLENLFKSFGKPRTRLNKVVIVGGGEFGVLIAEHLLRISGDATEAKEQNILRLVRGGPERKNLVIVESDNKVCKELSRRFPDVLVLNADISEDELFYEENLINADLLLAVTDNQELNIVTALYARSLGIKRSAVLVTNTKYGAICSRLEIDAVTSIKQSVINAVLRNLKRSTARSVHSLFEGRIEILELKVDQSSSVTGKPLHALHFPKDTLILAISRGQEHTIPDGNMVLQPGDMIVVIGRSEHADVIQSIFCGQL